MNQLLGRVASISRGLCNTRDSLSGTTGENADNAWFAVHQAVCGADQSMGVRVSSVFDWLAQISICCAHKAPSLFVVLGAHRVYVLLQSQHVWDWMSRESSFLYVFTLTYLYLSCPNLPSPTLP